MPSPAYNLNKSAIITAIPETPQSDILTILNSNGDVRTLQALEAEIISFALSHHGGHMSEVARKLGIGRSTLYRKVEEMKQLQKGG